MADKNKLLFTSSDWDFKTIDKVYKEIEKIALEELDLDMYPMNIEVISSDQMLDSYSYHGLPLSYFHWSFGKRHVRESEAYKHGRMGLAYEIIINTNPCIAYLMENNTMTVQTLVLAHVTGHNHFFKNNYLYRQWTQADFIIDYMKFAKTFILECEEKYGVKAVEEILDACHAIQFNGVDRYKRPPKISVEEEKRRLEERAKILDEYEDPVYDNLLKKRNNSKQDELKIKPEENLLYFIEKNSPGLKRWQKEIVRIVRKISQYFYPQMQDKVMNEGFACFCHYYIMNRLWEKDLISEGSMLEFLNMHSAVTYQSTPDFRTEREKAEDAAKGRRKIPYSGINPYALGFAMFQDIKRICENPTQEDREWFPDLVDTDWKETILDIVKNYRDESFVRQFLSPKVIRDFKLFAINNNEEDEKFLTVTGIHNEKGYRKVRKILADEYDTNLKIPNIQVVDVKWKSTRTMFLDHQSVKNRVLQDEDLERVLGYLKTLWGYDVVLRSYDDEGDFVEQFSTKDKS